MIYEPSEDSFLLAEQVKKYARNKSVLDIGSGSGIQAFTALENGAKDVLAIDINRSAVKELRKKGLNAVQSDLFSNVKGKFYLIIFNPPYLPFDSREDNESSKVTSGGKKGDEIIIKFLRQVKDYLDDKGIILLVVSSLTPQKRIIKIFKEEGLTKKVLANKKLFMEELQVWEIKKK